MPLIAFFLLAMTQPDTLRQSAMQSLVPPTIGQWAVSEAVRFYTGAEIFDYMDGAGEVYLAYGSRRLLVQRYARPNQEEILVEIFDMGLPRNAFGAYSNMQGRAPMRRIGQEAEYKNGLLTFWKGRFFVCVMIDHENDEATKAVLALGRHIADAIREEGAKPGILDLLPKGKYLPATLRYFYRHEILNIHFYLASANLLSLNEKTDAVLVRITGDKSRLLLIQYPNVAEAVTAYATFTAHYMPDAAETGAVKTENKRWTAAIRQGACIAVVFDARTQSGARALLESVRRKLP